MIIKTKYDVGDVFYFKTHSRKLVPLEKTVDKLVWKTVKEVPLIAIEGWTVCAIIVYNNGNYVYDCENLDIPGKSEIFSEAYLDGCKRTKDEATRMKAF